MSTNSVEIKHPKTTEYEESFGNYQQDVLHRAIVTFPDFNSAHRFLEDEVTQLHQREVKINNAWTITKSLGVAQLLYGDSNRERQMVLNGPKVKLSLCLRAAMAQMLGYYKDAQQNIDYLNNDIQESAAKIEKAYAKLNPGAPRPRADLSTECPNRVTNGIECASNFVTDYYKARSYFESHQPPVFLKRGIDAKQTIDRQNLLDLIDVDSVVDFFDGEYRDLNNCDKKAHEEGMRVILGREVSVARAYREGLAIIYDSMEATLITLRNLELEKNFNRTHYNNLKRELKAKNPSSSADSTNTSVGQIQADIMAINNSDEPSKKPRNERIGALATTGKKFIQGEKAKLWGRRK